MEEAGNFPIIVGFVADLMFQARIETTAARLGYHLIWIENEQQLVPNDASPGISINTAQREKPLRVPTEQLTGSEGVLLDQITTWRPALLIFDLGNGLLPWREWLALLKSAPATRRIPTICYGSHVDKDTHREAQMRGADAVFARSRFMAELPELIQKFARVPDIAGIQSACKEPLSPAARQGLELFNRGEYYEAHEYLEEAWNDETAPGRDLYQAILQVAVAYLHIERGNYNGAAKLFLRMRQWIEPLPNHCRGVDVERLRQDARAVQVAILALGPEHIREFDRRLLKPVFYRENG